MRLSIAYILFHILPFVWGASLEAQCLPPQIPADCDSCKEWKDLDLTICHGGVNYTATLEVCTQFAVPPNPIANPCTGNCTRALDAITWVRRICVDPNLKNLGEAALIQAIIKGTNLCCKNGNFLGVTIPECSVGTDCKTSIAAYCHILAMPKCTRKNYITGCYDKCTQCVEFCMVERRYCRPTPTSCCKQWKVTCNEPPSPGACELSCDRIWDCNENYFKGISDVCCD